MDLARATKSSVDGVPDDRSLTDTPEQRPGVYCACLTDFGLDPRKVSLRCPHMAEHAAGLDAAVARSAEHEAAQGGGEY